jgi:hypothetical protein
MLEAVDDSKYQKLPELDPLGKSFETFPSNIVEAPQAFLFSTLFANACYSEIP